MKTAGKDLRGFTLIELMVAIAVLAILVALAAPSFAEFRERSVVRGAADDVVNQVGNARLESVKRNRVVTLSLGGDRANADWCLGAVDSATACACATANVALCPIGLFPADGKTVLRGAVVSATGLEAMTFDPSTGALMNPSQAGNVDVSSPQGMFTLRVNVNPLGRADICVPADGRAVTGVPAC